MLEDQIWNCGTVRLQFSMIWPCSDLFGLYGPFLSANSEAERRAVVPTPQAWFHMDGFYK